MEKNNALVVIVLSFVSFSLGVAEFVPMGLLIDIANDFNRSIDSVGVIVSVYALGAAIGTPILIYFITRFTRKTQMLIILSIFVVSNLVIAFTHFFPLLVFARVLSGVVHGSFFAVAILTVSAITSEKNRAFSVSLVVLGLTLSLVVGVPLGTFIGKHTSWEFIFLAVALLGIAIVIVSFFILPKIKGEASTSLVEQLSVLKSIPILRSYAINILMYAGMFNFVAYLSKSLDSHRIFDNDVSFILLCFGVAAVIGNLIGGKIVSFLGTLGSLRLILGLSSIAFGVFYFVNDSFYIIALNVFIMGFLVFAIVAPIQLFVMENAKADRPHAIDSAMGFQVSTIQIGIAFGSFLGGVTIALIGIEYTAVASFILFFIAFILTMLYKSVKKVNLIVNN